MFIIHILTFCALFTFALYFSSKFLYARRAYHRAFIGATVIVSSVAMVLINTLRMPLINYLMACAIFTSMLMIFFKGNFALKLGFAIIIATMNGLSEGVLLLLVSVISELQLSYLLYHPVSNAALGFFALIVFIVLGLLIIRIYPRKFEAFKRSDLLLVSFQVLMTGTDFLIVSLTEAIELSFITSLFVLVLHIALLAFSMLLFFVFDSALRKQELERQNEFYRYQFEQIKSSQAVIGKVRHDIKKHLLALKLDLANAQPNEAERKIDAVLGGLRLTESVANSGDPDFDAILNYKGAQAQEHGTRLVCGLCLPYTLNMDTTDLSVILCNAIDNAVEACKRLAPAERVVNIDITYEKPNLHIVIANPFTGELKTNADGEVVTTKHSSIHGIGLHSIRDTVEKYDGLMDIKAEGGRFTLKIILFNLPAQ